MKIEDQVCSLELAKELKELGCKQESLFWWVDDPKIGWKVYSCSHPIMRVMNIPAISAFTVSELGVLLHQNKKLYCYSFVEDGYSYKVWSCTARYREASKTSHINTIAGETEANARAKMLCYLLKNKLIEGATMTKEEAEKIMVKIDYLVEENRKLREEVKKKLSDNYEPLDWCGGY